MAKETKRCPKCQVTKGVADFQKCARRADGLQAYCRECRAAQKKDYRARNRDRINEKQREYDAAHRDERKAYYLSRRDELLAAMKDWREANREQHRDSIRAHYEANRETYIERTRQWRLDNPERYEAAQRAYYEANRERFIAHGKVRRARRRDAWVEYVDPLVVLERADGECGICGGDVDPLAFHVDHVIPLSRGGDHSYANTQAAHPACNMRKHTRLPEEMTA